MIHGLSSSEILHCCNVSKKPLPEVLRRSELGDRTWRFEVSCDHGHADHTAHFLCSECGAIACLPDLVVTPRDGQALPIALVKGAIEVQILGRCDTCLEPVCIEPSVFSLSAFSLSAWSLLCPICLVPSLLSRASLRVRKHLFK